MSNEENPILFFAAVLAAGGVEAQEAADSMKIFIAVGIVMSICRFGTIGRRWSVS